MVSVDRNLKHGSDSDRFQASGDEAGSAPGDRSFRPDVEGLRAAAVLLVVLFHAGVPGISGGYVGVDVFFVISGFVITGLLLRERAFTGRTSILAFYGRRCRRIIPAATLVIVVTTIAAYALLGVFGGDQTATDGRWAAFFLANVHFAANGTNYLSAQQPPSALQNFWSLAVEEQFYIVYPALFALMAGFWAWRERIRRVVGLRIKSRSGVSHGDSLRMRLAIGLMVIIAASFTLSVVQTSTNPTVAYFSPLTRAWELALGALVAVSTEWLLRLPVRLAATATWVGLGAIVVSAVSFTSHTAYPGSLVAIPVVGAALIIGGGVVAPRGGTETVLGLGPFRGLGKLSYSLYLWHWPILVLAAQSVGRTSLPFQENLVWVLVALGASIVTYAVIENPIRHAHVAVRNRWVSIGIGVTLVFMTGGIMTAQLASHAGPSVASVPNSAASPSTVSRLVVASTHIRKVPVNLFPSLSQLADQLPLPGFPPVATGCWPPFDQSTVPSCVFGDPHGKHTMVLYGDSQAGMWFQAMDDIATKAHWRLVVLTKAACFADSLPYVNPGAVAGRLGSVAAGPPGGEWSACDQFHRSAIARINRTDPDLLIISEAPPFFPVKYPGGRSYTPTEWKQGLEKTLKLVTAPKTRTIVLGDIPIPGSGPACLSEHMNNVQACSRPAHGVMWPYSEAEMQASNAERASYVDVTPWFCATRCSPIIGRFEVYWTDGGHINAAYSRFLENALAQTLDLQADSHDLRG